MPEDCFPNHFLSWLTYGPAADNQHPLWFPDTGKAVLKSKADIFFIVDFNGKIIKLQYKGAEVRGDVEVRFQSFRFDSE